MLRTRRASTRHTSSANWQPVSRSRANTSSSRVRSIESTAHPSSAAHTSAERGWSSTMLISPNTSPRPSTRAALAVAGQPARDRHAPFG
jgi:hypothetical protein